MIESCHSGEDTYTVASRDSIRLEDSQSKSVLILRCAGHEVFREIDI
jgi:hypothetical protein